MSFLLMRALAFSQILSLSLFCSVVFAQSPSAPRGAPETGLAGEISIGPIRGGPTRQGVPDSKPLPHTEFVVVAKENKAISSFQTDNEGRFRISLPPGHYTISAKEKSSLGHYGPFEVDIAPGEMKKVKWSCDSGIR